MSLSQQRQVSDNGLHERHSHATSTEEDATQAKGSNSSPTPQQRKLASLHVRQANLNCTLAELKSKHTALLIRLIPHIDIAHHSNQSDASTEVTAYMPSTHAHSIPVLGSLPSMSLNPTRSNNMITAATESAIMTASQAKIKEHIKLLHKYNEVKDVAQGLIGMIAEQRGLRIVDIMPEFDVGVDD